MRSEGIQCDPVLGNLMKLPYRMIEHVGVYYCIQLADDIRPDDTIDRHKLIATNFIIHTTQARFLKRGQPNTPQGHRDTVLFCLLLDHGLRCGEAALLKVEHIDFARWELRFERPKVNLTQTHKLTADTIRALTAYRQDLPTCDATFYLAKL